MTIDYPLISCICVTRNKPSMLERSIQCFLAQTYSNKEMIILYEDDDVATAEFIDNRLPAGNIRVISTPRSPDIKLGQLRNMAIQAAAGAYVCQWDDDDWYHMSRLEYQYQQVITTGCEGCMMMVWVIFDATSNKAYISNYRPWEGSIFCSRELLLNTKYANTSSGEEAPVLQYLLNSGRLHMINDVPWLYIYVYHGSNTWQRGHWHDIFKYSLPQSEAVSKEVKKIINHEYDVISASCMLNELAKQQGALVEGVNVSTFYE